MEEIDKKSLMETIEKAVNASNKFEINNSDLKREYILSNIILYNTIAFSLNECKGTFGTGYPFYALKPNMVGALPIIQEQIDYNSQLLKDAQQSKHTHWTCYECLQKYGLTMDNLKTICRPCPNIENELKPRRVINRLPDLDLWMMCDEKQIKKIQEPLRERLYKSGFETSDVDPYKTICDVVEIAESLQINRLPQKKLPIDTHLIDKATIYTLLNEIPKVLAECASHKNKIPYLPIHPLSLRKHWQKDDEAYNFVHDFFCSFTPIEMDAEIKQMIDETRQAVAKRYDFDLLYQWTLTTGAKSTVRRFNTQALKENAYEKFAQWEKGPIPNLVNTVKDRGTSI
ncbi:MAG: hypothetical protein MJ054_01495 [Clostridia bacterium]|nr:hypothetical protein [Clostridia bacterium]